MSVELRDATQDDTEFLAWVMNTAARSHLSRGIWEYIYDLSEAQILKYLKHLAGIEPVHFCHHSLFLIAEVDGEPAAALCGFDPATQGMEALLAAMPVAFEGAEIAMDDWSGVMERGAIISTVSPEHAKGAWIVENVATVPRFRRQGLVDQLLEAMLERGRSKGFELAQIGVFIGNEQARRAYVKAGFEQVDEKRDASFEAGMGCAGMQRLMRPLI